MPKLIVGIYIRKAVRFLLKQGRSTPASLLFKGQATEHYSCKMIYWEIFSLDMICFPYLLVNLKLSFAQLSPQRTTTQQVGKV